MNRTYLHLGRLLTPAFFVLLTFTQCTVLTAPVSRGGSSATEDRQRSAVIAYAKEQLGAPYCYAGRDPKRGFDCSGFTYYVLKEFEVPLSTSSRYQAKEGRQVDVSRVQPGDLIFFKRTPVGRVFHVAMVVANDRRGLQVIHSTSRGVVIDNITNSTYWRPKVASARDVLSGR